MLGKIFGKKKQEQEDNWVLKEIEKDDGSFWLTRRNMSPLPKGKTRKDYDHILFLTFHYKAGRESGFPSSADNDAFEEIEKEIINLCNVNNTLFVAVVFMPGIKDYLFYSNTPHEMGDIFQPLVEKYPQFKVEFAGNPDTDWGQYDDF